MSYFNLFPYTTYKVNSTESVVKDIYRRASFLSEYKPFSDLYIAHTVVDGDTPESLASKYYDSPYYHWVILLFNEIHDPIFEWPMTHVKIEQAALEEYGQDAYSVRHYERDGIVLGEIKEYSKTEPWVPPVNPIPEDIDVFPILFIDYMEKKNDEKRAIRILRPELLGEFVRQFETAINV